MSAGIGKNGHLFVSGFDVVSLAAEYDTPLYIYDEPTIRTMCKAYKDACTACGATDAIVHYAGKALLNTAIAQLVHSEGLALDVVSGGELALALHAGIPAAHIHMHGNAKTPREIDEALAAGIGAIVVDNFDELKLLIHKTNLRKVPFPIQIRVTPDIAADTHQHIQTGHHGSKFGFPLDALNQVAELLRNAPGLRLTAVHAHLGSQIFDPATHTAAVAVLVDQIAYLRNQYGITIEALNIGGGFPIKNSLNFEYDYDYMAGEIIAQIKANCNAAGITEPDIFTEFGSFTVGESGATFYSIMGEKKQNDREKWYMIDSSFMTTLPDAWAINKRFVMMAINRWESNYERVLLGGLTCDSDDYYNSEQHSNAIFLPKLDKEEPLYIGFFNTGAYQESISGYGGIQHCLIPAPKHVVIDRDADGEWFTRLFAKEQSYKSMLQILGY
jgi:arginine decarboxylase